MDWVVIEERRNLVDGTLCSCTLMAKEHQTKTAGMQASPMMSVSLPLSRRGC